MTAVADKRTEELATLSLLKALKCTKLCKKVSRVLAWLCHMA